MLGIIAAAALVTVTDGYDVGVFKYDPQTAFVANVSYVCDYGSALFYNINYFRADGSNVCDGKVDGLYSEQMSLYTTGSWVSMNGAPITLDQTQPDQYGNFVTYLLPQTFGAIRTVNLAMLYCHIFPAGNVNCANSYSVEILVEGQEVFWKGSRPVAVSPIPLPAAAWLFLAGLIGLGRARSRRP